MKRISKSILKCIMTFVLVVAMVLGAMPLPQFTITANAETTTSTVNVGGTDYTLFTGFTATAGTAGTFGYANFVDGNTSTEWQVIKKDEDESPFGQQSLFSCQEALPSLSLFPV